MQILEHIHVNVNSITATVGFLEVAVPDFHFRGSGDAQGYGSWAHFGDENSYIAVTELPGAEIPPELRHIGLVVEDIEALMKRLDKARFEPADVSALDEHPHRRRVYYIDGNGLDWEFVEYLSGDEAQRNDYSK
jgi:hypothetical protein